MLRDGRVAVEGRNAAALADEFPAGVLVRSHVFTHRAINEQERTAEYVAATETGVDSWEGKEYLRVAGCKLERYAKNPVFLDAHDRRSSGCVIGRVSARVEGRELLAKVEYAKTPRAQEIWDLVRTGFIRGVSVGFSPTKYRQLRDGESDGEGDAKVMGPGVVIDEWELYELSQVPVGADVDAVLRQRFYNPASTARSRSMLDFNKMLAPAPAVDATAPVTTTQTAPPLAALVTQAAPAASVPALVVAANPELDVERAARENEARARGIRTITPPYLREVGEKLVLDGVDVETARKHLLAEHARHSTPVGTPEPAPITSTKPGATQQTREAPLTEDDYVRGLQQR